ncbi:MAG: hypothetical protein JRI68_12890 [Deltaproteobacteria bacterium]|nr:hypothetical protein [Deltaproteobacteria bacterium]
MHRRSGPLLPLVLVLASACSGGSQGANSPDGAGGAAAEPPADESDYDRKLRLAKAKREQCDALATAIEGVQGAQAIININDSAALKRLAANLESAAEAVAAVEVTVEGLGSLQDDYVGHERGKATALEGAATAKTAATQRSSLSEYQQLDGELGGVIDDINSFCGAAPSE